MAAKLSRRSLLGGMVGGAAALALSATAIFRFGPAHGVVHLTSNENPYGPSPGGWKTASEATAKSAYYAGKISTDLKGADTATRLPRR
jgi:histidinol-phosphate/aromatic aminotransferase/cobyric acid decarboxylase-like protein